MTPERIEEIRKERQSRNVGMYMFAKDILCNPSASSERIQLANEIVDIILENSNLDDEVQRQKERIENLEWGLLEISKMTEADAEFNAANTAREALGWYPEKDV